MDRKNIESQTRYKAYIIEGCWNLECPLISPTLAAALCGRAAPAGGLGTVAATSLRGATMKEIPSTPVHSNAGTPGGGSMSTLPAPNRLDTLRSHLDESVEMGYRVVDAIVLSPTNNAVSRAAVVGSA